MFTLQVLQINLDASAISPLHDSAIGSFLIIWGF